MPNTHRLNGRFHFKIKDVKYNPQQRKWENQGVSNANKIMKVILTTLIPFFLLLIGTIILSVLPRNKYRKVPTDS